jgi:hypothetical protein
MNILSGPTSIARDGVETTAVPGGVQTGNVAAAWSVTDAAPDVVSGDSRHLPPRTLLAIPAGIAVAAVTLGAFAFGEREPGRVNALSAQSTFTALPPAPVAASPGHEVPASVVVPAANPAPVVPNTAPESRLTVTIEASPPAAAEMPSSPPAPSHHFDSGRDWWLLGNLRSLGYTIINPALVISSAYQACRLFQQGESPAQVNQQMSAVTGLNIDDTLQLTSSAMLAYYPDCA